MAHARYQHLFRRVFWLGFKDPTVDVRLGRALDHYELFMRTARLHMDEAETWVRRMDHANFYDKFRYGVHAGLNQNAAARNYALARLEREKINDILKDAKR